MTTPPELSIEWLRAKLVTLLEDAATGDEPDHQACAKYADILFKMLPKSSNEHRDIGAEELARAGAAVLGSNAPLSPNGQKKSPAPGRSQPYAKPQPTPNSAATTAPGPKNPAPDPS
mgnify:FL=1